MKVELIGSGGWDGIPSSFCRCTVCKNAAQNPTSKDNRTRPLLKVTSGQKSFCVELGPDFRSQSSRFDLAVDTFLISHWHYDHLFGIYELGAWFGLKIQARPIIYCSQGTADYIQQHMGFMDLDVRILKSYEPVDVEGVSVTPVPMQHMSSVDNDKELVSLDTFGFVIDDGNRSIAYLADYYGIPSRTLEAVKQCDAVVADGTYLFEDKYPDEELRTAFKNYNDPDHLHGSSILDFTKSLDVKKTVFHSITHLPEMDHDKMQSNMPADHFIGYDGMLITD